MTISSHQIHSVLRTYGKQLRRGLRTAKLKQVDTSQAVDRINISPEAKRKQVVEKVASEIINSLANPGAESKEMEKEVIGALSEEYGRSLGLAWNQQNGEFTFNVLESESGQVVKTLDGEESEKLNARLIEITEDIVDRKMVKG